ncbi:hypothetical protein L227DRAFT_629505 [Lentinus tigrinus ALCF2SS1-6]|uniref:Uncharacterized protein n=1 Tax=Lentinus tigrinus ALCF2SS1-6 TaxID=1328759 RepID=A0A5C2S4U6_9APHY|nr:hypothetical protein L227DRAFT_629505 [Lentinus tigrinus ALCF2SS1-6]
MVCPANKARRSASICDEETEGCEPRCRFAHIDVDRIPEKVQYRCEGRVDSEFGRWCHPLPLQPVPPAGHARAQTVAPARQRAHRGDRLHTLLARGGGEVFRERCEGAARRSPPAILSATSPPDDPLSTLLGQTIPQATLSRSAMPSQTTCSVRCGVYDDRPQFSPAAGWPTHLLPPLFAQAAVTNSPFTTTNTAACPHASPGVVQTAALTQPSTVVLDGHPYGTVGNTHRPPGRMGTQQRVALRTRMIRSTHDLSLTGRFCGGPVSAPGPSPQVLVLVLVLDAPLGRPFTGGGHRQNPEPSRTADPTFVTVTVCGGAVQGSGLRGRTAASAISSASARRVCPRWLGTWAACQSVRVSECQSVRVPFLTELVSQPDEFASLTVLSPTGNGASWSLVDSSVHNGKWEMGDGRWEEPEDDPPPLPTPRIAPHRTALAAIMEVDRDRRTAGAQWLVRGAFKLDSESGGRGRSRSLAGLQSRVVETTFSQSQSSRNHLAISSRSLILHRQPLDTGKQPAALGTWNLELGGPRILEPVLFCCVLIHHTSYIDDLPDELNMNTIMACQS